MKKITRRAALRGTAAAATVLVPGVAVPAEIDPLIGMIRALKKADEESAAASDALERAQERVGDQFVPHWGIIRVETDQDERYLGRGEIKYLATPDRPYGAYITAVQRDKYLAALDEQERRGRECYRELGLEPYLEESERSLECYSALRQQVYETPAKSVQGFVAKVALLCEYIKDSEPDQEFVRSVTADAERLAGEGRS